MGESLLQAVAGASFSVDPAAVPFSTCTDMHKHNHGLIRDPGRTSVLQRLSQTLISSHWFGTQASSLVLLPETLMPMSYSRLLWLSSFERMAVFA